MSCSRRLRSSSKYRRISSCEALAEGGVEKLNDAFNKLQSASHKLAEALYQQAPAGGGSQSTADQASAAGASSPSRGSGDDNVLDAEYVDVDDNK